MFRRRARRTSRGNKVWRLRRIEADNGTLMFLASGLMILGDARKVNHTRKSQGETRVGASGDEFDREGSCRTYVSEDKKLKIRFNQPETDCGDGWGFDVFPLSQIQEEAQFRRRTRGTSSTTRRHTLHFSFFLFSTHDE